MGRFYSDGVCKCDHINDGACRRCSCCDYCDLYTHKEIDICSFYPTQYMWGGQIRDKRDHSMAARPYFSC